jgi:hypothetical protein
MDRQLSYIEELFKYIQETHKGHHSVFDCDQKIAKHIDKYDKINLDTELKDIYESRINSDYPYSPEFLKYINHSDNEILRITNENLKYVNIGRIFKNFKCNVNGFKERLQTHIVNLHKIRVWNKKILMLKLKKILSDAIKEIGDCDDSIFEIYTVKSPGRRINAAINTALDTFIGDNNQKPIEKELNPIDTIVNSARSQLITFMHLYNAKTVSGKEYKYIEKIEPSHWVSNQLVIGSLSSIISTVSAYNTHSHSHSNNHYIKKIDDTANHFQTNAVGIIHSIAGTLVPVMSIAIAWMANTISNTKTYQELSLKKKILKEFIELKDIFKDRNRIAQEDCSYSGKNVKSGTEIKNKDDYVERFKNVARMISDFNVECEKYYNEIFDLCYDYTNVYDIICTHPIDQIEDKEDKEDKEEKSKGGNRRKSRTKKNKKQKNRSKKMRLNKIVNK